MFWLFCVKKQLIDDQNCLIDFSDFPALLDFSFNFKNLYTVKYIEHNNES